VGSSSRYPACALHSAQVPDITHFYVTHSVEVPDVTHSVQVPNVTHSVQVPNVPILYKFLM
jgi:hypothetical protein